MLWQLLQLNILWVYTKITKLIFFESHNWWNPSKGRMFRKVCVKLCKARNNVSIQGKLKHGICSLCYLLIEKNVMVEEFSILDHQESNLLFFFIFLLLFICAYKAWFISPPYPHPLPYHPLCQYPAETILPLFLILL
jgi:hypothetical protein